jgi:hypothetical protein
VGGVLCTGSTGVPGTAGTKNHLLVQYSSSTVLVPVLRVIAVQYNSIANNNILLVDDMSERMEPALVHFFDSRCLVLGTTVATGSTRAV